MDSKRAKSFVIAASLGAAALYATWLGVRSFAGKAGEYTDGETVYFDTDADLVRHAVWSAPESLGSRVNTAGSESRAALSPDGRWLVFAVGERGLDCELYACEIVSGEAHDPRPIATLNTTADELAPAFSATHLYFASDRSGGQGGLDLWRAEYTDGGFAAPERLAKEIQSGFDDTDPAPLPSSDSVVFASNRAGNFDLYRADASPSGSTTVEASSTAAHATDADATESNATDPNARTAWTVRAIEPLNTAHDEREPAFLPDGHAIYFASDRSDSRGSFDLYRSANGESGWLAPVALDGLDTELCERAPAPTPDGFGLYFARGADERTLDLFRAHSIELFKLPHRGVSWVELAILASLLALALAAAIARRYPALDFIYKCFLVSILLHLALLFWFQYVYMHGGTYPLRGGGERHRVRWIPPATGPLARVQERAGEVEFRRSETPAVATEVERESFAAAERDEAAPERDAELAHAPRSEEVAADAEARERTARADTQVRADVALDDVPDDVERRSARAPELGIASAPIEHRPTPATTAEPERFASRSRDRESAAPEAWEPVAPDAGERRPVSEAPARADVVRRRAARESDVSVAVPSDRATPRASESAPSMTLAPSASAEERANAARSDDPGSSQPERFAAVARPSDTARPRAWSPARDGAASGSSGAPAPAREHAEVGPTASARSDRVGVAAPQERAVRSSETSAAPSMSLEPSASGGAGGTRSHLDAPERLESNIAAFGAPGGRGLDRPSAPDIGELRAAAAPTTGAPTRAGGAAEPTPSSSRSASVALEDKETIERRGAPRARDARDPNRSRDAGGPNGSRDSNGTRGASGNASDSGSHDGDILAGLAPSTSAGARVRESGAPELDRWTPPTSNARESARESSSLPPLVASPDRGARDAPPEERARWDNTPYQNRAGEEKARALELFGGTKETEEAVARGLAYLASIQQERGNWGDYDYADEKYAHVAVGKTGLALLAFLGAGHTPSSSTQYSAHVARAIEFLVSIQDGSSGHFGDSSAYCHGIATYALAECLALTQDAALRDPLSRAVEHILSKQSHDRDPRFFGGWGYYYADDRVFDPWPRTSITSWQVMALESARLSGLSIPDAAFDDARTFLRTARDDEGGYLRYNHDPERLNSGYPTLPASTPAGLFALSLVGEDITSEHYRPFLTFVLNRIPKSYRFTSSDDFVARAQGNSYFWYYATLAMFRAGGRGWEAWNEAMKKMLLPAQDEDGSWRPIDVYARYAHDRDGDRSYTTAVCVLSLEVYYRYYLPLLRAR